MPEGAQVLHNVVALSMLKHKRD